MNPDTLRDEAESLRTDPRGLGIYSGRVAAHADAWEADRQRLEEAEGRVLQLERNLMPAGEEKP